MFIYYYKISSFVLYNILFFQPVSNSGGEFGEESLENAKINCECILPPNDQRKRKIDQNHCIQGGP